MTTGEEVRSLGRTLSNWGRWGDDDELGTLNFITPDAVRRAATCVKRGDCFSLSLPLDEHGPARSGGIRANPVHEMTATGDGSTELGPMPLGAGFTDDTLHLHLQCASQWDSLAHVHYDGLLYNGFPATSVSRAGAVHNAITVSASSFVGRGVLLDVARHRRVSWLAPDDGIDAAELDAVVAAQGVEVRPGDILLVRTGLMQSWHESGSWDQFWRRQPGLVLETASWLHRHEIAAVAADNTAVERIGSDFAVPLHMVALRDMGMCFGELWDLEELAEDCVADGVYEVLLAAPGLRVTGGVGSPVNPIAMK
jgi:kynurenine formamidase